MTDLDQVGQIESHIAELARKLLRSEEVVDRALSRRASARMRIVLALRAKRAATGETYRELGKRLGCSAAVLHDIEHGRRWSDNIVARWTRREAPHGY